MSKAAGSREYLMGLPRRLPVNEVRLHLSHLINFLPSHQPLPPRHFTLEAEEASLCPLIDEERN